MIPCRRENDRPIRLGPKERCVVNAMRAEYRFDYRRARPNRFAAALRDRTAVVLDPDVASVFASQETVNKLLRSVIAALPHKTKTRRARANSTLQVTTFGQFHRREASHSLSGTTGLASRVQSAALNTLTTFTTRA